MSNFYRFPAMVKPDGWTVSDQLSKIEEETREAIQGVEIMDIRNSQPAICPKNHRKHAESI